MRYYYDETGEQQIIGDTDEFHYTTLTGQEATKLGEDEIELDIEAELMLPNALSQLGVNVDVVMPVMDHELLRPERMNNDVNFRKVLAYRRGIEGLVKKLNQNNMSVRVASSLDLFGEPSVDSDFMVIKHAVRFTDENQFGISNKTYEFSVNVEYRRNVKDLERNRFYRSKNFARLCREYDIGEARVHSLGMLQHGIDDDCAGVIVRLPQGAEADIHVYNLPKELIVYTER